MRTTRLVAASWSMALVVLAGCGTETGSTGTDVATSTAPASAAAPGPTPGAPSSEPSTLGTSQPVPPDDDETIGTVLTDTMLGIEAGDVPGAPMPLYVEVSGADELESTYPGVPGVSEVAEAIAASPPAAGERLFVYVAAACLMEDISLELAGREVTMVVRGNTTIKCQPPPMHMVVWKVGADEVPPDAVPAQAVQKK